MPRISEQKVLNFGKNFFGKVSNFGSNLCPEFWKKFLQNRKIPKPYHALNFENKSLGIAKEKQNLEENNPSKINLGEGSDFGQGWMLRIQYFLVPGFLQKINLILRSSLIMSIEIVILPSFEQEIKKIELSHRKRILTLIRKIESSGLNALKILKVKGKYLLAEVKSKQPPYRLYVFVDQEKKIFYIAKWEHKKEQKRIVKKLSKILEKSLEQGLEQILFSYFE